MNNRKANESRFPVFCYIIFHDCVGDHFIIHYLLFHTISLLHLFIGVNQHYPCIHVINHSWCSLLILKNIINMLVKLLSKVSQYILPWWDQKCGTEIQVGIPYSLLTIYHTLLPNNHWKSTERDHYNIQNQSDIFFIWSLLEINILFKIMNYLVNICFEAE